MSPDLIVTTEQGKVRGKTCEDYHGGVFYSFSGIPYAKAPIGPLRFKAPQPPEPYEGIRDGTNDSFECPQLDTYFHMYVGNEDNCLNLNIYTKEIPNATTKKKPVMVWIYGGGFLFGSNKSEIYGPHYLMTEDIVLVAINYRLGTFGFLCLEDQSLGVPGNAGLKDQVMALKWIQKNIHAFNGDADNVTIFGESAGSASVHYLTLSPTTKGLFHRAIMQSGCALNRWTRGKPNALVVAKALGYRDTAEKTIYDKLCKESAKNIVNAQTNIEDPFTADQLRPLCPVIEYPSPDAFLTEHPIDILKSGRQQQVPIIIGYNSLEGQFYEIVKRITKKTDAPETLECEIPYELKLPKGSAKSKELAERIQKFYYGDEKISDDNVVNRYTLMTDVEFVHGIQKATQIQSETCTAPAYLYKLCLDGPLNYNKKICQTKYFYTYMYLLLFSRYAPLKPLKNMFLSMANKLPTRQVPGVAHADDLTYLFTTFFTPKITKGSLEDIYIQKIVKLWTNFAKFGNPTPEIDETLDRVIWKPVSNGSVDAYCVIDKVIEMKDNEEKDRVEFWHKVYEEYSS